MFPSQGQTLNQSQSSASNFRSLANGPTHGTEGSQKSLPSVGSCRRLPHVSSQSSNFQGGDTQPIDLAVLRRIVRSVDIQAPLKLTSIQGVFRSATDETQDTQPLHGHANQTLTLSGDSADRSQASDLPNYTQEVLNRVHKDKDREHLPNFRCPCSVATEHGKMVCLDHSSVIYKANP